jgi:hypothetical protein
MSHIDSFPHEIVGLFGGLPVYHPLDDIRGDFECSPRQIVLGGGSGEHPALVIDPLPATATFLADRLSYAQDKRHEKLHPFVDAWSEVIAMHVPDAPGDALTFYDWTEETHRRFRARCMSAAMPVPYEDIPMFGSLETWLARGFGEFIFYAMPELVSEIIERLDDPYEPFFHIHYNNILLIPPNMPVYANGGNAFGK